MLHRAMLLNFRGLLKLSPAAILLGTSLNILEAGTYILSYHRGELASNVLQCPSAC